VSVEVPATSANLGPGFDVLGVALGLVDEVTASLADRYVIEVSGEGAGEVPTDESHLVVTTMLTTFDRLGVGAPPGLRLSCVNRIPHARGLGSSSAAIVAGILLARALAGAPDDRAAALALAAELEGHPDNVAPCLYGGFTIAWADQTGARATRLTPSGQVRPVLYVPAVHGLTAYARSVLPAQVPHRDAVFNVSRTALLVHALTTAPELLLSATEDRLHQPYRAAGMPVTAELVEQLRTVGVPAVVSGAGPSVLGFSSPFAPAPQEAPPGWVATSPGWSTHGARIVTSRHAEADPVAAGRVG